MSIFLNGSLEGFFSCSRGVRQGDHLSPILFGKNFLSCYTARLVEEGSIKCISSPRGLSALFYLFFADDALIFALEPSEILELFWMFLLFMMTSLVKELIIRRVIFILEKVVQLGD